MKADGIPDNLFSKKMKNMARLKVLICNLSWCDLRILNNSNISGGFVLRPNARVVVT